MTTLLADGTHDTPSLIDKVLKVGGIVGLIAFLLVIWLTQRVDGTLTKIAESQQGTLTAVHQHEKENERDRKAQQQLLYAMCRSLAKVSKSDPELCEVNR